MLHPEVLTISYKHRYELNKRFRDIIGFLDIGHFSLDLARPDGQMIFLSGTPSHGYEVCSKGFGAYDPTISSSQYKNHEFYWWHDVAYGRFEKEIQYIREVRHGFRYGFMLVRQWDDFYLIYSFATSSRSNKFIARVEASVNTLFEMGDSVYNSIRELYSDYTESYTPPLIDHFYPYVGGRPVARYSHYRQERSGVFLPPLGSKNTHPRLELIVNN